MYFHNAGKHLLCKTLLLQKYLFQINIYPFKEQTVSHISHPISSDPSLVHPSSLVSSSPQEAVDMTTSPPIFIVPTRQFFTPVSQNSVVEKSFTPTLHLS